MSYDYSRKGKTAAFDSAKVKQIARMVQENNHQEAYAMGAKMLGATELAKKFELITQLLKLEGHLPRPLGDYSYSLYKDMMKHAEQTLDPKEYEQFHAAF